MTTVPLASHRVERARDRQWRRRPVLRRALEVAAIVGPLVTSIGLAWLLTSVTPSPSSLVAAILRWLAIAAVSSASLILLERSTRRILPIASLFDLTLVFPDRAPSRFKLAIRTGTTRQLERRIEELRANAIADPSVGGAQRLLELVAALNVHDRITRGHSERVRAYTQMIAAEMGLSEDELDRVRWAGLLHDIGKLFIPTEILNKTSGLTDEEYEIIKQHPDMGRRIIEDVVPWLGEASRAVWEHHEKWDGTGYPRGLKGDEISLSGRIVAVADVYDVMTSARSYKDPISPKEARAELARCAGSHFDPVVVRAFLNLSLGNVSRATGPVSWLTQLSLFPTAALTSAQAAGTAAVLAGAVGASSAGVGTELLAGALDFLDPRTPSGFAIAADAPEIDPVTTLDPASRQAPGGIIDPTAPTGVGVTTVPGAAPAGGGPTTSAQTATPATITTTTTTPAAATGQPTTTLPEPAVGSPSTTTSGTSGGLPPTTIPSGTTLPSTTIPPVSTTLPPILSPLPTTMPPIVSTTLPPILPTTLPPILPTTTVPTTIVPTTLPIPIPPLPTTLPPLPGFP